jgi:hypothetical protein
MSHTTTIPQAVSAHYHACYNNQTYSAFSRALASALGLDEQVAQAEAHDQRHTRIMNLLTDAALELAGAEVYAGAGTRLGSALGALDDHAPTLVRLAIDHLNHFVIGEPFSDAHETIAHMATLALAESARRALVRTLDHAALLHGWRGTTSFYWLLACTQIIQSAEIVLRDDPSASYLVEKFGKGIELLARGTGELVRYGNPPQAIQHIHTQLTASPDGRDADGSH